MATVLRSFNPALTLARAEAYARSVMANARRTKLNPKFILSIVTVESGWRANAVSPVGAEGLGQLMPGTAARLGVNPRDPAENLRGTSRYLETLVHHFAGKPNAIRLAIAGYNAGPKAVEEYGGIPPYAETQNYVVRVLHVWNQLDARVGHAFAARRVARVRHLAHHAVRVARVPVPTRTADEQQWLSTAKSVLPAQSPTAATTATAASALTAAPGPHSAVPVQPAQPAPAAGSPGVAAAAPAQE